MAAAFSVFVNIGGKLNSSLGSAVKAAEAQVTGLGRRVALVNSKFGNAINSGGKKIQEAGRHLTTGVTLPMGLLGASAGRTVFEFEKAGNAVRAVTEMTREQRLEIEKLARSQKHFTPQDSMKSALELGKTGFNADQIKGTLEGALKLALAGDIAAEKATDIVTNVMTSMQLPMQTAGQAAASMKRVGDVFSYTANKTNTDVEKLGETFKYVGSIGQKTGLDIETVAAAAGAMANAGIRGSEAGVALRSALVRLVRPTKPAMAAMARLGVNIGDFVKQTRTVDASGIVKSLQAQGVDASGARKEIEKILANPTAKFDTTATVEKITSAIVKGMGDKGGAMDRDALASGITDALIGAADKVDLLGFVKKLKEKGASMADISAIFDTRQGSRLLTLFSGELSDIVEDVRKNAPGYFDRAVELRLEGIVGAVYRLNASWSNFLVTLAKTGVLETVASSFEKISDTINRLGESSPALLKFSTYTGLAAIALGPFAIAAGATVRVVGLLSTGLVALGNAATVGLAGRLVAVASGINAITVAATIGAVGHLRAMAAGLIALGAVGGSRAVLGAIAGGLLSMGRAILMFPLVALRAISVAMLGMLANPVGIAIAAIVTALTALGVWVYNNWSGLKDFFEWFGKGFKDALPPSVTNAIETVGSGLKTAYDYLSKLLGPLDATQEIWRGWGYVAGHAVGSVVMAVSELPGKIAAETGKFYEAGANFIQSLWDGAKAKFSEFIDWVKNIPSRIIEAIGKIDLSNIIRWPSLPSWMGGGGPAANAGKSPAPLEARARGGPVSAGKTYLVGENGPELFKASSSGEIVPNDRLQKLTSPERIAQATGRESVTINNAGHSITVNVTGSSNERETARHVTRAIDEYMRRAQYAQRGLLSD